MENYLYLLEIFVETVTFAGSIEELPKPSEVIISGEVGKFIKVDIFSMRSENDSAQKEFALNCGRSSLFSSAPAEILRKIQEHPLILSLSIKGRQVAQSVVNWTPDFRDLVKRSLETFGVTGPVKMQDRYLLKETKTDVIMGDIKAVIKLSSFGTSIQTSYQLINTRKDANKKYLIRGARGETTFECEKISGSSSDMFPVAPLFSTSKEPHPPNFNFDDEQLSWMALFKSNLDPKISMRPPEFDIAISNIFNSKSPSSITFDIVSIKERPEEGKFIDLRIRGGSQGFVLEFDKSLKDVTLSKEMVEGPLTTEKINRLLCNSKDCPAAQKFKEYGIGPLAKIKGLGTLRGDTVPPVTYGLSQTYGVFDEYGPYGLFSRPKRPENSFVPKNDVSNWNKSCWKPKRKRQNETETEHHPPLRLTGGGVAIIENDDVKSPLRECKEIINQFDEILFKYKNALGPCGKPTCPFAPNIMTETCKRICHPDTKEKKQEATKQYLLPPSIKDDSATKQTYLPKGACGSPKCAYAKHKSGMTDEDAIMELQYLPSAPSGRCGHPKCPYPIEPELPPIHWDCPDPLPKGRCKNPDCPHLPKELKCLNAVLAKGPCANLNCPYALPDPCKSPTCPFGSKSCPYQQNETPDDSFCDNPDCPFFKQDTSSLCDNPDCPYASQDNSSLCDNPDCPFAKKDSNSICDNPECPLKNKPSPSYLPRKDSDFCDNPDCPFSQKPPPCQQTACPYSMNPYMQALMSYSLGMSPCNTEIMKLCFGGPGCPLEKKKKRNHQDCENSSDCLLDQKPLAKNKKRNHQNCENSSDCLLDHKPIEKNKKRNQQNCENSSDCLLEQKPSPCYTSSRNEEVCSNTSCPLKEESKKCYKKPSPCYIASEDDDNCDNPNCPYASSPCGGAMPCGYGMIPILQALVASCLPLNICNDLNCPLTKNEITQFKEILQMCFSGIQPPRKRTPVIKEKNKGPGDTCDNPSCPYQEEEVTSHINEAGENPIEYTTDARTDFDYSPCTKATCKSEGGQLVCAECPCGANDEEVLQEGATEHKTETRTETDMAPCNTKTCCSLGGKLVCDDCPTSTLEKDKEGPHKKKIKRQHHLKSKGKKRKSKYVYSIGDKYPGVQIGHKECVMPSSNVPKEMGWLWNVHTPCLQLKPRRGWRPGAIAKTIAERIRKHREAQGLQMLHVPDYRKGKKGYGEYSSEADIHVTPKPTLSIKKKDGCYWITMNPLKDPHTLVENESPYMDCTPMQFKIVKNKDKQEQGDNEYKSCFCGDDGKVNDDTSSSDSELDIEFTPPAGIIHPERFKKKRNVVHGGTQYLATDFEVKSQKSAKSKKSKKGKKGKKDKKGKGKKGKKK